MKGPDWFLVGLRLTGVWLFVSSALFVVQFFDVFLGITPLQPPVTTPYAYLFYALCHAVFGLCLLVGAKLITRLCFGDRDVRRYADDGDNREAFSRSVDLNDPI